MANSFLIEKKLLAVIFYCKICRMPCMVWFACANIDCPDWTRIWLVAYLTISFAISASRILLSAYCKFSALRSSIDTEYSKQLNCAPILLLNEET